MIGLRPVAELMYMDFALMASDQISNQAAKWHYIFPMFQQWKIFEMPAPGYLGFLPFALECFVMYVSASALLRAPEPSLPEQASDFGSAR